VELVDGAEEVRRLALRPRGAGRETNVVDRGEDADANDPFGQAGRRDGLAVGGLAGR